MRRRVAAGVACVATLCIATACSFDGADPTDARVTGLPGQSVTTLPLPPERSAATLEVLPPVERRTYPETADAIVFRITVRADDLPVPLLTIYGDRTTVSATTDGWRTGTVGDIELQQFLAEAAAVGLLDTSLVLRTGDESAPPLITIDASVDRRELRHELDLAPIERATALRAFLQRAATANPFGLDAQFTSDGWITCAPSAGCSVEPEQRTADDRPVLPGDPPAAVLLAELQDDTAT